MYGILIFLLLMTDIAQANVYVVTDRSNAVYSLSEQNDAIVPSGYTSNLIKNQTIANLPITGDPSLYDFRNGTFTINAVRLRAQQAAQADVIAQQTTISQAKASAIAKLTDAISKVATQDVLTQQELQALLPGN